MNQRHARRARALPLLLLASVVFSATFGIVHTHGSPSNGVAARESKIAGFVGAADLVGDQTDGLQQGGDCPICQLHRQLSGGLLYGPVFTPTPPTQHAPATVTSVPYFSASSTPQRGRAPPRSPLS